MSDYVTNQGAGGSAARAGGPRTGTVVWGLVLLLVGAAVAAVGAGYTLDLQAVLIVVLVLAGTALLVGSILQGRRNRG